MSFDKLDLEADDGMVLSKNPDIKKIVRQLMDEIRTCDDERELPRLLGAIAEHCPTFYDQYELLKLFEPFEFPGIEHDSAKAVAQFYNRAGNGGAERVMVELASLFSSMGKKSMIITNQVGDADAYRIDPTVLVGKVDEFHLGNINPQMVQRHLSQLLMLLRENGIDAYVYHAWLSLQCVWDLLLCRLLGIRFVVVIHNVFSRALAITEPERTCFALIPHVVSLCDAAVCLTDTNLQFFSRFNDNAFVIPNPFPKSLAERFKKSLASQNSGAGEELLRGRTVLWLGRLSPEKRPFDALHIMKHVLQVLPDTRLVVVGKSEDGSYERRLAAEAESLGIASSIQFEGYSTDIERYFSEADLFLFTSEVEGYPMVLLEAAATGTPVVMYDLPYLATSKCVDWISFAPLPDVEIAASEVVAVLENAAKRNEMSEAALTYADYLSAYDFAKAWERVLACVCRKGGFIIDDAERVVWDTLFDHYVRGDMEADALFEGARASDAIRNEVRTEFERSTSWRIGRLITAIPRKLLGRA